MKILIAVCCFGLLIAGYGCGAQQIAGNKPEDRMNPAMSAHQKQMRSQRQASSP